MHLLLLDVDGVLVAPRAYMKALQDTVSHIARQMGLGEYPPTEEDRQAFEANGLSSEWDMGAAVVGVLLLERLRQDPSLHLPGEWGSAVQFLAAHPCPLARPHYVALAEKIGTHVSQGLPPAQATREALWGEALVIPDLSRSLSALSGLLDTLFSDTRSFYRSPVTRLFDQPLLAPDVRQKLEQSGEAVRLALYTLRPSLPPVEAGDQGLGYAPEAEMARGIVGLEKWPLIGLGHMQWLAQRNGTSLGSLVKPAPVQALAAIAAAWSGQEMAALQAALSLHREGRLEPPLTTLQQAVVHVFEDTCEGIASVQRAVELLQTVGIETSWQAYGIAPASSSKAAALVGCGARIYPSVNEAITTMLRQV